MLMSRWTNGIKECTIFIDGVPLRISDSTYSDLIAEALEVADIDVSLDRVKELAMTEITLKKKEN